MPEFERLQKCTNKICQLSQLISSQEGAQLTHLREQSTQAHSPLLGAYARNNSRVVTLFCCGENRLFWLALNHGHTGKGYIQNPWPCVLPMSYPTS